MKLYQLSIDRGVEYENKMKELIKKGIINEIKSVDLKRLGFSDLDERDIIILTAFNLGMNWTKINNILEDYGYGKLYAKEIGDVRWIYAINNGRSIMDVISKVTNSTGRRTKIEER